MKAKTALERVFANAVNAIWNYYIWKTRTINESEGADAENARRNSYGDQVGAIAKCAITDVRNAAGNGRAGKTKTPGKCVTAYACDDFARNVGRDIDFPTRPRVVSDGDRVCIKEISRIGVLGLNRSSKD